MKERSKMIIEKMNDNAKVPKVVIEEACWRKMNALVRNCDKEIGWLGLSKKNDNVITIYDIEVCDQECGATNTDLKESAINKIAEKYLSTEPDKLNDFRVWGHSHVNMATSPSKQDDETFMEYYNSCEYFVRLILNKKGEYNCSVADEETNLVYHGLDVYIAYTTERSVLNRDVEEIKEKLKETEEKLNEYDKKENTKYDVYAKEMIQRYVKNNITTYKKNSNIVYTPTYLYNAGYYEYDDYDTDDYYDEMFYSIIKANSYFVPDYKTPKKGMINIENLINNKVINIDDIISLGYMNLEEAKREYKTKFNYKDKDWQVLIDICTEITNDFWAVEYH